MFDSISRFSISEFDRISSDDDVYTLRCPSIVIVGHLFVTNEVDDRTDPHEAQREEIQKSRSDLTKGEPLNTCEPTSTP